MGPQDFNPTMAALVFLITALMDVVRAAYVKSVARNRAAVAATSGALVYLISAFSAFQFSQNLYYLLFVAAGSWTGTYAFLKIGTILTEKR